MPAPELSHLYETAVLWPNTGIDRYGQPTLGTPEEIRVRWDDSEKRSLDPQGNRISVDATAIVDRDISVHSEMWLGKLDEWVGTGTGQDDETVVMTVKTFNRTPDVRGRYTARKVGMLKKASSRSSST